MTDTIVDDLIPDSCMTSYNKLSELWQIQYVTVCIESCRLLIVNTTKDAPFNNSVLQPTRMNSSNFSYGPNKAARKV